MNYIQDSWDNIKYKEAKVKEYMFYQIRTKAGDGDYEYFTLYESPYLIEIIDYIAENELQDYIVKEIYVKELTKEI